MKLLTTFRGYLAGLMALTVTGGIARAQTSVPVPDFSFENVTNARAGGNGGAYYTGTNWSCDQANSIVYVFNINAVDFTATGSGALPPTGDGTNFLVENIATPGSWAYCWQDLGPLLPNTTYTLTIALGQTLVGATNAPIATGQGFIALYNGVNPYQTQLGATFVDNSLLTPGTFADYTLVVTTPAVVSGDLTIAMVGTNAGQLCFDNVRLTKAAATDPTALPPLLSPVAALALYQGVVVTLTETPAGTGPFTYQWQTDNGSGGASFTSIPLATNASYVLTNSSVATTEYRVIVTNHLAVTSTSAPTTLAVNQAPPEIYQDVLPSQVCSDVVGSSVTFSVVMSGDQPMGYQWYADYGGGGSPIAGSTVNGTTNSTLTLTNLQISDSAFYYCLVTNDQSVALGPTPSSETYFTVNPVSAADSYGVIQSPAVQYGLGNNTSFTPTWALATNSLIAKTPAFSASPGNFALFGAGGTNALTDGSFGPIYTMASGEIGLATLGNPTGNGSGYFVSYLLPTNASGWDITNIIVYGGWADGGRDQQSYDVFFSTIAARTSFANTMDEVNFKPNNIPDQTQPTDQVATKVSLTASTPGTAMAKNVAGLEFNMNLQASGFNANGWQGYAEIQVFGTPSAAAPVFGQNMVPSSGTDVAGSAVTMSCVATYSGGPLTYKWTAAYADGHSGTPAGSVTGTAPAGTTNSSLTLTNLQTADSGTYTLLVYANGGVLALTSLPCIFTVNPAPTADALGVIDSTASQTGTGTFTPTWMVAPGSLIAGLSPTAAVPTLASFVSSGGDVGTGVSVLTDGIVGFIGGGNDTAMAVCGTAGHTLTYTLPGSTFGYNISKIVIYGGWNDGGRDEQVYEISASPVSAPGLYNEIIAFDYKPPTETAGPAAPNMTRASYTPATGSFLAENISQLFINFDVSVNGSTTGGENGYQGYSEIDVYGTMATGAALTFVTNIVPGAGSDVTGSTFTMYCAATTANPPLTYQWNADYGAGPGPISGTTVGGMNNSSLVLTNLQLSDTATYTVTVTDHAANSITSLPCVFTVNSAPTADNYGVLDSPASQQNPYTTTFTPTWPAPAPGSLIAGLLPSALSANNGQYSFTNANNGDAISNGLGLSVLTDNQIGYSISTADSLAMVIAGSGTAGGNTLTYTLPYSEGGYNITNIQIYGGWGNGNRDEQLYTIYYSTVSAPLTFTPFISYDYRPPLFGNGSPIPNMTRMTYTSATAGVPMAQNVSMIYINFTTNALNANTGENGYQGYSEIDIYGTPSAAAVFPPSVTTNTLPSVCQDAVGSAETFVAGFSSSSPMTYQWVVNTGAGAVPVTGSQFSGVNTPVLTDGNIQLADAGSYSCVATVSSGPAAGTASTVPNAFAVTAAPVAIGNIIITNALQAWSNSAYAQIFTPTWTVQPGSLIAGTLPSKVGLYTNGTTIGSFGEDGQGGANQVGGGGVPVLTDGFAGTYGDNTVTTLASCGSREGSNLVYTLASSGAGYNLSKIVTYGGWANNGRDEQAYTILYSTAAAPTTFVLLTTNDYKPASILTSGAGWNNYPNSSRSTIVPVTGVLAANVYAVQFNFQTPNGENNWEGYGEIQIFGTPAGGPTVNAPTYSGGNLHLSGTGGTPGAGFTCLTSTNVAAPLSTWTTNSQANFDGTGAFSITIPVVTSGPSRYFEIRVP